MSNPPQFRIPDTLRNWPWPRILHPGYEVCAEESKQWILGLVPEMRDIHKPVNPTLLGSLAYHRLSPAGLRLGCDLLAMFVLVDEHTDVATASEAQVEADIIMDALRNHSLPRPDGEWIGGEVMRSFWENAIKIAHPAVQRQFVEDFQDYLDSVVKEAEDRDHSHIRDVDNYLAVRYATVGAIPSFDISAVEMDLPQAVFADPTVARMRTLATYMIAIANDICSYNVEQARGDDQHNIIRVVMDQYQYDVTEAMQWTGDFHDKLVDEFLETNKGLPSFGEEEVDRQTKLHIEDVASWVRANWEWSFETERYFGKNGPEVKRSLVVDLLPRSITRPRK